jgi:hypothetical protein
MNYYEILNRALKGETKFNKAEEMMLEIGAFNNTHVWKLGNYFFIDSTKDSKYFNHIAQKFGKKISLVLTQEYFECEVKEDVRVGGQVVFGNVNRIEL